MIQRKRCQWIFVLNLFMFFILFLNQVQAGEETVLSKEQQYKREIMEGVLEHLAKKGEAREDSLKIPEYTIVKISILFSPFMIPNIKHASVDNTHTLPS